MNVSVSSLSRVSTLVLHSVSRNASAVVPVVSSNRIQEAIILPLSKKFSTISGRSGTNILSVTSACRRSYGRQPNVHRSSPVLWAAVASSRSNRSYTQAASTLTREQLHDLVYRLNEDERELLMNTLKQFESNKQKAQFEADSVPVPATRDLMKLGLVNALPFIGFGFLDNFTMIIAGDYIEHTLGLFMCISTMAAAALGNTISDVIGIGSAFYVEKLAEMSGVRPPKLTPIQMEMKSTRRAANMGRVIGITIGCLLGMCPLLFWKDEDKDAAGKKDAACKKDAADSVNKTPDAKQQSVAEVAK